MIKLINGRGQLGQELNKIILHRSFDENITIYHTWNVLDKSEEIQKECFKKFKEFVDNHLLEKIIFISTYSQTDNPYNYYKQLAESYLINHCEQGKIIRLPVLIGKGICDKFRNNEVEAFGEMELISLEDAVESILNLAVSSSKIKSFRVYGTIIPAKLVKNLITFGKNGVPERHNL